jgi:tetratricopeptide (TPR) repeat protein
MKSLTKLQIGIITFSVLTFVLLYFAFKPGKQAEKAADKADMRTAETNSQGMEPFVNKKTAEVQRPMSSKLTALINVTKAEPNNTAALDSLVAFWDNTKQPDMAAYYTEKIAAVNNTGEAWIKAGERYYFSVRFVKDQAEMPVLYQQAMRCFEKGLEKDPNNIEAKIKYASCFVEGSSDPMKGITLLKEVEKVDSNNINLQLAFAQFSTTSGQIDKAIMRLEKVIRIKPDYLEAYLYLADAYEQMGNKQKTIETLEKYAALVPDKDAKKEIKSYIDKLKSNN